MFHNRYTLLAADECKANADTKKAGEAILTRLVNEQKLVVDDYRVGQTKVRIVFNYKILIFTSKVFFKAGVLARLEDERDVKMAAILTGFQVNELLFKN